MEVVGGIVEGVSVVGNKAGDGIADAGDVAQGRDEAVESDTEMPHDDSGSSGLNTRCEFGGGRTFRIVMDRDLFGGVLVGYDLVQRGSGGLGDVHEGEHGVGRSVGQSLGFHEV